MGERITKVSDLAKGLGFGKKTVQAMEKHVQERSMSRMLTVLRVKAGLSQKELAQKMGVSQSAISKLENAANDSITFADAGKFLSAIGYEMTLSVSKPKTIAERIIGAYAHLTRLIEEFQGCRRDDPDILVGMAKFETEAARNVLSLASKLIENSNSKLVQADVLIGPRLFVDDKDFSAEPSVREAEAVMA